MAPFFQQIFNLITSDVGRLTYQFILAFSITGALLSSLSHWNTSEKKVVRRMVFGLFLLLVVRLAMFVVAALAWQGLFQYEQLLPILDRGAILLSLVIIIWLWAFPQPSRRGDAAAILASLLVGTLVWFGMVWWSDQGTVGAVNGSLVDIASQVAAILLLFLGLLLLLNRRPAGWGYGFLMLGILLSGHILQLLYPPLYGDYPSVVRVTQMLAYPLLFLLPQRLPAAQVAPLEAKTIPVQDAKTGVQISETDRNAALFSSLGALLAVDTGAGFHQALARLIAVYMTADVSLLVLPGDQHNLHVACGYDSKNDRHLPGVELLETEYPALVAGINQGRTFNLPDGTEVPSLLKLAHTLGLKRTGPLLIESSIQQDRLNMAVILFSPYTGREWTSQDQAKLGDMSRLMAQFLLREHQLTTARDQAKHLDSDVIALQQQCEHLSEERKKLLGVFAIMQQKIAQEHIYIERLAANPDVPAGAGDDIASLQVENNELEQLSRFAAELGGYQSVVDLERELHNALEEVALLQTALVEAEGNIKSLRLSAKGGSLSHEQRTGIIGIAGEVHQSASSIIGYSEFLLGESIGMLDDLQRKFVERSKDSAGRIDGLVGQLEQRLSEENALLPGESKPVDINTLIERTAASTASQIDAQGFNLRLELEQDAPALFVDHEMIELLVANLFLNAGSLLNSHSEVVLQTHVISETADRSCLLLTMSGAGSRTPAINLPDFLNDGDALGAPELSEGFKGTPDTSDEFTAISALVDAMDGRLVIEGEPGSNRTISVYLPLGGSHTPSTTASQPKETSHLL